LTFDGTGSQLWRCTNSQEFWTLSSTQILKRVLDYFRIARENEAAGAAERCRVGEVGSEWFLRSDKLWVKSLDCIFDASLAPETCLKLPVFTNLIQDSVRQAKAENR